MRTPPLSLLFILLTSPLGAAGQTPEPACEPGFRKVASEGGWRPDRFLESAPPASKADVFRHDEPIELTLSADLTKVKKSNAGGNWTSEDRADEKFWSLATLTDENQPQNMLAAKVRGRGMSSADDSEFPKLRLEIVDETDGSAFKGAKNLRINTHVSTDPKTPLTEMGRLNDERSPYREALGYEMARAMGLPTPAFRRARINYHDRGTGKTFRRQALLLETDKKTAERYGAKPDLDFPGGDRDVNTRFAALYHLFHVLAGNEDVGLKLKGEAGMGTEKYRPLFNTTILEKDGQIFPIVYDLDLSTLLAGLTPERMKNAVAPEFGLTKGSLAWTTSRLANLRARLSRADYETALKDLFQREPAIRAAIKKANVDEAGRALATEHLDLLKQAAQELEKIPMLQKEGVEIFADKTAKGSILAPMPASESAPTLAPGTPIKVLATEGEWIKVAVLDPKHHLAAFSERVGYVRKKDLVTGFDLPPALRGFTDERDMTW